MPLLVTLCNTDNNVPQAALLPAYARRQRSAARSGRAGARALTASARASGARRSCGRWMRSALSAASSPSGAGATSGTPGAPGATGRGRLRVGVARLSGARKRGENNAVQCCPTFRGSRAQV